MDQDIKDGILGIIMIILIVLVISLFIYAVFIHEPQGDSLLPPKDHYTYYIDMDSHSKLNEYLINDIDVREAFKAWSDKNDILFKEVDQITVDYKKTWFDERLLPLCERPHLMNLDFCVRPYLPKIIVFFSETSHTYGLVGHTKCYMTIQCTIEIVMGQHDCNNEYRLYNHNYILNVLKQEIGNIISVVHPNDRESITYIDGFEFGDNRTLDDYNIKNLTKPNYEYSDPFKDYNINTSKDTSCFYTPPFLSYDWFNLEYRKIFYTLTNSMNF